jgi:hypothetical protein
MGSASPVTIFAVEPLCAAMRGRETIRPFPFWICA